MNIRHSLSLILVLTAAAPLFAADDATYDIRLQRPFKSGQSFTVSATTTQRTSQSADVPTGAGGPSLSMRRVSLGADVHIDKVDDAGTQASVTIRKLELLVSNSTARTTYAPTVPDAPATLLPPGTEVLLTYGKDETTFTLKNKQPLAGDALTALQQAFQKMAFKDDMYGATGKKKIGESWSINTQSLLMDRTHPQAIDPSQVSGTVTLKSARQIYGLDCVVLECAQTTKDVPVAGPAPKEAISKMTFTLTLPAAVDRPLIGYSVKVATHIVVPTQGPGTTSLLTTADSEVTHETTWVPR